MGGKADPRRAGRPMRPTLVRVQTALSDAGERRVAALTFSCAEPAAAVIHHLWRHLLSRSLFLPLSATRRSGLLLYGLGRRRRGGIGPVGRRRIIGREVVRFIAMG